MRVPATPLAAVVLVAMFAVAGAGCSAKSAKAVPAVTQTVTQLPTDSPSAVDSSTESDTDTPADNGTTTDTGAEADPSASSTGPVVIGPGQQGVPITIDKFFAPDPSWSQDSYDVASRKAVQGISSRVSGCNDGDVATLQLRLGDNYKTLTFFVGQANDSESSDQNLVVDVSTNSSQIMSKKVPFNTIQPFSVPVTSVNAVVLSFHLDSKARNCAGAVNPVIFSAILS